MKQVSEATGISESMYCLIENGKRNPSLGVLRRLAEVLDSSIDDLVRDAKK